MIGIVNGVLSDFRGPNNEHGRIEVLSFKINGETILDKLEIKKMFPPFGFVFAHRFSEIFGDDINSILEFHVSPIPSSGPDSVVMDINKGCKKIGIELYSITMPIFENEFSINQPILKSLLKTDSSNFFIKNDGFLFGPFKFSSGDIVPRVGKEVNKYKNNNTDISLAGKCYLLTEPTTILAKVDCMTPNQLSDWLKKQIQNLDVSIDYAALQNALQAQELKELDRPRLMRVLRNIEHVSVNLSHLKVLATASKSFRSLFEEQIRALREELRGELITPINNEKSELEKEVVVLKNTIKKLEKSKQQLSLEFNSLAADYKSILSQKDRLIEDIKVHSLVGTVKKHDRENLQTFEEQAFLGGGDSYENLLEFLSTVNSSIENLEAIDKRYIYNCFNQLAQSRIILTDNFSSIIQFAKLSNNCRLFIQQVEPTWIKFEYFYENGLRQIWKSAHSNPDEIHFLMLEDINLASIECYGRPVLDILAGIRQRLPGLLLEWPRNLWIMVSPVIESEENSLGLPLIIRTFEKCAAFPRTESPVQFKHVTPVKVLRVGHLVDNEIVPPNYLKEYF